MRDGTRRWVLGCAAAGAAMAVAAGAGLAGGGPDCDTRFVVHEWGTFTSMQGAGGIALEGLSREEESLPEFVYSRTKVRDCPLRDKGWKGLEVPASHVTQKMETPVIYFHSVEARKARVRVDFAKGLLTQWYPVSDLVGPPEGARDAGPLDVSKVEKSFLQWDVDVLARGTERPERVPGVAADDPWTFAREVDANWVQTLPRKAPERAGPVEAERYLFYRGLGSFPMPLTATVERGAKLTLRNARPAAVEFAIVLDVDGDRGRIRDAGAVAGGGEVSVQLPGGESWGPLDDVERKLQALVGERLRTQGLNPDEARAMVRTWSRSWFRSEGTRVIWLVPRTTVDALLPLSIDPKPDATVRVLVGRMELIPPEVEDADYAAILAKAGDAASVAQGNAVLERRGRFLEPHLRNVVASIARRSSEGKALATDDAVRARAQSWIEALAGGAGASSSR